MQKLVGVGQIPVEIFVFPLQKLGKNAAKHSPKYGHNFSYESHLVEIGNIKSLFWYVLGL